MRRFMVGWLVAGMSALALTLLSPPAPVSAQLSAGVVLDRDGLRHFHLALGHVYGLPVQTVHQYHPAWVGYDELPVVYLLAREAWVSPDVVLALRQAGWSWIEIADHLRVDPYIFVAHLPAYGPPHGVARGYWRKPSRRQLRRLSDRLVIEYVNLHFWSVVHRRPVTEIIVIRERYPTWTHYVRVEAPRVRFQEPPQTRTAWWNEPPQAQPRPAQPRQGAAPQAAPSRVTQPAPARGQAPARSAAPARGQTPTTAPAPARGQAPSTSPAPARGQAPAQTTAPARGQTPTTVPAPARGQAPATIPAPARQQSAPAQARTAPLGARTSPPAPAARNQPAAASRSQPAPAARTQPPAATRNPPPAAARPPAQGSRPAAQGSRPAAQGARPAAQSSRPAAQASRPPAQASRPPAGRGN